MPLTLLRYKIESGSNMPDQLYQVTLVFAGSDIARVHDTPLDQVMSVQVSPDIIDENGNVGLEVINGNPYEARANPLSITFPPDGLELSYSVASFPHELPPRVDGALGETGASWRCSASAPPRSSPSRWRASWRSRRS